MRGLYSLLQKEVKSDLNETMYVRDLSAHTVPHEIFAKISAMVDDLIENNASLEVQIERRNIEVFTQERKHLDAIHAQMLFEDEKRAIWFNPLWIERYTKYMDYTQAETLHIAHEFYHVLEMETDFWYTPYPYKLRNQISEVSALLYSQRMAHCDYHPRLYEYRYGLDDNQFTLEELIQSMKEGQS